MFFINCIQKEKCLGRILERDVALRDVVILDGPMVNNQ